VNLVSEPLTPERRRQQTRDYLLAAAAQVFSERGFHGTTLDEVAAAAGFTKGAVYSNFKSKDDLFLALLESRYQSEMSALRATAEAAEGPPEAHLYDFVEFVRNRPVDRSGQVWSALYQEFVVYALRHPTARQKLAELEEEELSSVAALIEAERQRHGIEVDLTVEHAARIVTALMRGVSTMQLIEDDPMDETFLRSLLDFIARGLNPGAAP
jgi:AcrR family transcriptional regulator